MKLPNFNQPHQLFLGSTLLIWLAVLLLPTEAIDIQFHDTYIVIAYYHWAMLFTIILGGIGFLYWLFREKQMIHWMTIFHTIITIIPIVSFFIWYGFPETDNFSNYIEVETFGKFISFWVLSLLFLLGQIFFIINLLRALFKD